MKQITAWILIALLCLALTACSAAPEKSETAQPESEKQAAPVEKQDAPAPEQAAPAEEAEAPAEKPEAPAEETLSTEEIVAKIIAMQGQSVEELIDWLGEPQSREYSSSCLIDGGQDGQLYYEGFTVYTLVQPDGTETIDFCE